MPITVNVSLCDVVVNLLFRLTRDVGHKGLGFKIHSKHYLAGMGPV